MGPFTCEKKSCLHRAVTPILPPSQSAAQWSSKRHSPDLSLDILLQYLPDSPYTSNDSLIPSHNFGDVCEGKRFFFLIKGKKY